jgi:hypothetical protein
MILITYSIGQMKALGKRGGIKRKRQKGEGNRVIR